MSLFRKILMSLMVIGGIASLVSAGTYASFNATTQNASSSFATGSLVLDRKVGATSCFSVGAGTNTDTNANTTCGAVINDTTVKLDDPNTVGVESQVTADLTIQNVGSTAGTLTLFAADADPVTGGVQTCLSATNNGYWTGGTGNVCTTATMTIQEYTSATFLTKTATCAFPFAASVCGAGATPSTLSATASTLGAMAANQSRYYRVTVVLPSTAVDNLQGRRATFRLTWQLAG